MNKVEFISPIEHTKLMEEKYHDKILDCIDKTEIFREDYKFSKQDKEVVTPVINVINADSVATILAVKPFKSKKAILNFASYTTPGGGYIHGSMAQEEALCQESFLYNVLSAYNDTFYEWNCNNLNSGLYLNRVLYTPDVLFTSERLEKSEVPCDVITCAAPNMSYAALLKVTKERNSLALRSRIGFILDIAVEKNVDTLILGAFGCGVFGQNPIEVAEIFKQELANRPYISKVVFAIIGNENLSSFVKVFNG